MEINVSITEENKRVEVRISDDEASARQSSKGSKTSIDTYVGPYGTGVSPFEGGSVAPLTHEGPYGYGPSQWNR